YANENWYNAHNFYGDLEDLDAATLEDVQSFFNTYYSPNNAALSVVGDFEIEETKAMIEKYFGAIPRAEIPAMPDISEKVQQEELFFEKEDKLATKPAIALAYDMPERNSPEYYAMGLLDQILVQGDNSLLHKNLVKDKGYTAGVNGGINYLGNMFNYNGPMQWMFDLTHDADVSADSILATVDKTIAELERKGVNQEMLDKAMIKIRSQLYDDLGQFFGLGRADLLCSFALFDDNPQRINTIESEFKKITPEIINQTIKNYLRKTNRTILTVKPLGEEPNS
ncbi:MAG: insulinase family protein, partial [Fulvivirga sp.]